MDLEVYLWICLFVKWEHLFPQIIEPFGYLLFQKSFPSTLHPILRSCSVKKWIYTRWATSWAYDPHKLLSLDGGVSFSKILLVSPSFSIGILSWQQTLLLKPSEICSDPSARIKVNILSCWSHLWQPHSSMFRARCSPAIMNPGLVKPFILKSIASNIDIQFCRLNWN